MNQLLLRLAVDCVVVKLDLHNLGLLQKKLLLREVN